MGSMGPSRTEWSPQELCSGEWALEHENLRPGVLPTTVDGRLPVRTLWVRVAFRSGRFRDKTKTWRSNTWLVCFPQSSRWVGSNSPMASIRRNGATLMALAGVLLSDRRGVGAFLAPTTTMCRRYAPCGRKPVVDARQGVRLVHHWSSILVPPVCSPWRKLQLYLKRSSCS